LCACGVVWAVQARSSRLARCSEQCTRLSTHAPLNMFSFGFKFTCGADQYHVRCVHARASCVKCKSDRHVVLPHAHMHTLGLAISFFNTKGMWRGFTNHWGTVEVGEWDNPKGVAIYHAPPPATVPRSPVPPIPEEDCVPIKVSVCVRPISDVNCPFHDVLEIFFVFLFIVQVQPGVSDTDFKTF
jgi:hypothetical protein